MRASELNRRVRIEQQDTQSKYANGIEWVLVDTVWADVFMDSGRTVIASDALISEVRASVRIRYRRDIRAGMRVVVDGQAMRIEAVRLDLRRRQHVILICVSDER
ncbi:MULTISPECIES: phage head closure protein [unclassified Caballeronia]|uniref:phage head closure protein n=1 Tax=unclassified Caballeronia TaxID=2646786 RepID=UPI002857247F|nr:MULTISPECIES: phage head closure protein [unclassified Caballeronia]MDR5777300.1 phage head closure protein [Caballeronia sp. LZ002]MDR5802566.1 phage head closure protein [Caballeronia sp. LZ001]MDR5852738.1 phage head closure protein [Caballeronia sp. LZ003]